MGKFILKLKPDKEAPTNFKSDWVRYGITIVDDSAFPKMLFIETDCPSNFPPGLLEKWDVFPEKNIKPSTQINQKQ